MSAARGLLFQGSEFHLAKLHHRAFCLDGDLSFTDGALLPVIHENAVEVNNHFLAPALDEHLVPFSERLLGSVGQIEDAAGVSPFATPLLVLSAGTPLLHVGNDDVLVNTPEVASVAGVHLDLNGSGEHLVEGPGGGGVDEDAAVESALMGSKADIGEVDGHLISAEISGNVWKLLVEEGSQVSEGQPLVIVEAMKMEFEIVANASGKVTGLHCQPGSIINAGDPVLVIDPKAVA